MLCPFLDFFFIFTVKSSFNSSFIVVLSFSLMALNGSLLMILLKGEHAEDCIP